MNPPAPLHRFVARLFAVAVLAFSSSAALAQADPPGRVGRLNFSQGSISFSPAGDNEWTDAQPNRPLTKGDRLWTDRGSRAEIQIGSSAVRLDGQTRVEIMVLDDQAAQLSLTQGSLYVRVRSLPDGENFEVDTPNLAYRAAYPGDYRIDVDAADGTTRVTIHSGTGAVYGEGGHAMPLAGGQQITFRARSLSQVATQESPPQDAFDRWAAERNRQEDQSIAARYVPREVVGYQQLDAHGQWKRDSAHGAVWFPQGTPANWAPYRNGRWEWVGPWGWTWIDDAPWGFAPFHYGRWVLVESRWAWVPGQLGLRPVYAPALVAFVGNGGGILSSLAGRSGVAWFPLAPGEMWQPGFHASGAYISNVNRNMLPGSSDATYAYQRRTEALTAISGDDFARGRPTGAGWLRIATDALTNAAIVPPPARPESSAVAQASAPRPARAQAQPDVRQVNAIAIAQAEPARRGRDEAQRAQQARPTAQAKAAWQARRVEPARQGRLAAQQQARTAPQTQRDQQRKMAEQAKVTERTRRAEIAKTEAQPQAKHAKRTQIAATKREQQARREGQQRVAARARQARHDEELQRIAHAQRVEQARRSAEHDAQVLREQRVQHEAQARREADEQAQRQAMQRQQAAAEQLRREQQAREEQLQLERARSRPDLRDPRNRPPEIWQRGIPILNSGRTS